MSWYVLQCKPNQVRRAQDHLDNQGFATWCPSHNVKRIVRRQATLCEEVVFPGYLFIALDPQHTNWRALNSTRGVARVVSFNGAPFPVPDYLMAELHRQYEFRHEPAPLFNAGERVRITEGCFRDIEAIIKAVTADDRVIVLLRLLNNEHALTLEAGHLALAY